jgi:rhamnosyltransferase
VTTQEPGRANVVAVIVAHHPDADFPGRFRQLAEQVDRVLVVDNCSRESGRAAVEDFVDSNANVSLLANAENVGIAAALNQGCRFAVAQGASWVAMFDQDSIPAPDLVSRVVSESRTLSDRDRTGLIGVNFQSPSGRTLLPPGAGMADARVVITSGSLLNLEAWRQAGPFREDFFIDEVDHEYAIRLRRSGWRVKLTRQVLMSHAMGSPSGPRLGGWRPLLSHHSALRRYYMVRNRVLLARAHGGFDPRFVGMQLARSLRESATVVLFEPEKVAKLRAMTRGLVDGLRGRSGQFAGQTR